MVLEASKIWDFRLGSLASSPSYQSAAHLDEAFHFQPVENKSNNNHRVTVKGIVPFSLISFKLGV